MFDPLDDGGAGGGSGLNGSGTSGGNWWEGPPPSGYTGPWPPPLAPGAHYGPLFGQIIYDNPTPVSQTPGYNGDPNDPTKSPDYNPGYFGNSPAPVPTPTPGPGPNPGPNPGQNLIAPFTEPYNPSAPQPLPTVGGSVVTIPGAPSFPNIPGFTSPTFDEAANDPGYKFVLDQGTKNLQNWAAARGTLNDSSTAKALIDYGQNAATTQYGNVWDRAFNTYRSNVETQYLDPFAAAYQNWVTGTVGPTMSTYNTNAANVSHLNDVSWQQNWNKWLQDWNIFRDQRDSTFNKQFAVATA